MPRKRKSDTDEIRELKEKLRKLERNQTRERYHRIRVLSSSSDSSTPAPQSTRGLLSKDRSQTPRRSPSVSRSPSPTPMEYSQGARSGEESDRDFGVTSSRSRAVVVHASVHAPPKSPREPIKQANLRAPPATTSREIQSQAQRPLPSQLDAIILAEDVIENEDLGHEVLAEAHTDDVLAEPELSSDILEILGDDPSVPKTFGKDIHKDLAIRLNHIATNGLSKELRKELREKYPIPANCTLIDAPQVNPEVKAAISETTSKRLGAMEQKQKQLSTAISCLGEAITLLLSQKHTDPHLLKLLMDAARITCDTQHSDSLTRRFFILASLKKEMKDQLLLTKIDSFLFGKDLSETLKSAKAINKSGAELKPLQPSKPQPWRSNNNKPAYKRNNLNTKTPPSSHRSTGSTRPRAPAPRNQPATSSRSSRSTYRRNHR